MIRFLLLLCLVQISCTHQPVEKEDSKIFSNYDLGKADPKELAKVTEILSNTRLKFISLVIKPLVDEKLSFVSEDKKIAVYGTGIVKRISSMPDGKFEGEMEIISLSPKHTVRVGDQIVRLDLSSEQKNYLGRADHIISGGAGDAVSSRYKALFTQGLSIGETAETLWKDEFLFTYYGQIFYGVYDFISIGTVLPLNLVGSANGVLKIRLHRSATNIVSTGLSYTKIPNTDSATFNINFMWDSISNEDLITHNFMTLAVVSYQKAEDASAIKSLGTSSLQTGYEFIMNDWSRILVGPNFNFEKKSVGGYFSYLKIWDRTHLQFSINSTNIRSFKLSPSDGYYAFLDAYWRY
ncbi:MAG: hypothetical protein AABY64_07090 [Bdellovibrionota bacterium]